VLDVTFFLKTTQRKAHRIGCKSKQWQGFRVRRPKDGSVRPRIGQVRRHIFKKGA
jgi:hypothetical protein